MVQLHGGTWKRAGILGGLVAVCAAVVVGTALSPFVTALAFVGLIAVGATLAFPTTGVFLMVALFLIQGSPVYTSYGVFSQGATASDAVGGLVLASLIIGMAQGRCDPVARLRGRAGLAVVAVWVYFLWAALSVMWSQADSATLSQSVRNDIEMASFFTLMVMTLVDARGVRQAAATYAIVGTGLALYVIAVFHSQGGFNSVAPNIQAYRGGLAQDLNADELGAILAVVPGFAYIALEGVKQARRLLLTLASIPAIGVAVIIVDSRQVLLSVALAIAAIVVFTRGYQARAAAAPIALLGGLTLIILVNTGHLPWYFQNRFQSTDISTLNLRLPIWQVGWQDFVQHPITGVGAEQLEASLPSYIAVGSAQSDFVRALADFGLIGFMALLAMLSVLGRIVLFQSRRHPAAIGIAVILLSSMVAGSMIKEHWMMPSLGIITCFGLLYPRLGDHLASENVRPGSGPLVVGDISP
ncbi:MAG: O-antigen ligase family protein [Chloroflexota bacterium]